MILQTSISSEYNHQLSLQQCSVICTGIKQMSEGKGNFHFFYDDSNALN